MKKNKRGKERCDHQTKNCFKLNDSQWSRFISRALPRGFYSDVTVILDELLCYAMTLNWQLVNIAKRSIQGLQILLMSGVTVTSASQILESFWKIWSQVSQRKKPFSDFTARGPGMNNYRDGYTV